MELDESKRYHQNIQTETKLDQGQIPASDVSWSHLNPAAIVQRVGLAPDSLTPADIMQLQKMMGNEAVCQLFQASAVQGGVINKNSSEENATKDVPVLQQEKNETQRGMKQRRITKAKEKIDELKGQITPALKKHIFEGKPIDKAVDKDDPQGLHAYVDETLPPDVHPVETEGSTGRVHTLKWYYKDHVLEHPKESTMFPKWMPKDHVIALIVLKLNNTSDSNVKTYVSHGQDIEVVKSGDTVYPRK